MIDRRRITLPALLALGAVTAARPAQAFCRSTTGCADAQGHAVSQAMGDSCYEATDTCPSQPLVWGEPCVGFSIDTRGSAYRGITADETRAIAQSAFDAWLGPVCDGEPPGLSVQYLGPSDCATFEYNPAGSAYGNANAIFFVDALPLPTCGGSSGNGDTIGDTCTSFDRETGALYDADIALDSAEFPLMAPDSDLRSVLLHEVGHFLGLAHVTDNNDVMFFQYNGQLTLSDDNKRAICAAYPPGRMTTGVCSYLPRHGYSPDCSTEQQKLTCSAAASDGPGSGVMALAVLGAGVAAARRRRRA